MATIPQALAIAVQHHQAGRLQAAEQIYRQILAADPDQPDAVHLLGLIAHQAGKHEVAVEYISRAIALNGNAAVYYNNLGEAYRALRKMAEAAACYRRAVELKPDYAEAHNNLGIATNALGQPEEAVTCYRRALALKPGYADAHNNLGTAFQNLGKADEAMACYRRALALKPNFAEAHSNLGTAFQNLGKFDEAVACQRRALELRPDYVDAHSGLGLALRQMGDLAGAEQSFRAALRHDPRCASAHHELCELLGRRLPPTDLAVQRRLLEDPGLTGGQRSLLHFGLAYVLDAQGEYPQAAEHLDRANALQLSEWRKAGSGYDPQKHESVVTRTMQVYTPELFRQVRGLGSESELPVFVVGLPRSGTTLVVQILASHSQVFGAGELKLIDETVAAFGQPGADFPGGVVQLTRQTAQHLASQCLEKLRRFSPTALRIVDKMPDNYLSLGLLASLFPRAKFIHCRRDLRDVAASCWMTHFQEIRWANDRQHIASRFQQYRRMMEHWQKVLPVPMLEVNYEDTVADLEGVARKLVAWCHLEWEPACLEFHRTKRVVKTASSVQVRQPIYKTSVQRWKHYEHALGSLFAQLETPYSSRSA